MPAHHPTGRWVQIPRPVPRPDAHRGETAMGLVQVFVPYELLLTFTRMDGGFAANGSCFNRD